MSSALSVSSTPNDTQANSSNVVRSLSSSLPADRENGQFVRIASLSTPTTPTSRKPPINDPWSKSEIPSVVPGPILTATTRPAPVESEQESNLKNGSEVTPKKDNSLVTTVSRRDNLCSQPLPVQSLAGIKPTGNPNNTVCLATEEDDEYDETSSISHQDDSDPDYIPNDKPRTQAETIGSPVDQEDGEGSQLETTSNSSSLKPVLSVEQSGNGIGLSWDLTDREDESKVVKYELYVMSVPTESTPSTSWESLGVVDALPLPMACTMTQFNPGASYYFAVRAITANGPCELFSDHCSIKVNGPQ